MSFLCAQVSRLYTPCEVGLIAALTNLRSRKYRNPSHRFGFDILNARCTFFSSLSLANGLEFEKRSLLFRRVWEVLQKSNLATFSVQLTAQNSIDVMAATRSLHLPVAEENYTPDLIRLKNAAFERFACFQLVWRGKFGNSHIRQI